LRPFGRIHKLWFSDRISSNRRITSRIIAAIPGGKQPWYFAARDGSPALTAAGLWDEWKDRQTGERLKSCTMIITEPNAFADTTIACRRCWLKGVELLRPASENLLQRWPVSRRVNSSKESADDPTLIDPVAAPHT
jgi:putative SOS response-associated peptidase YedK